MRELDAKQRYLEVEKDVSIKQRNRERLKKIEAEEAEKRGKAPRVIGNHITERVVNNQNSRTILRKPTSQEKAEGVKSSSMDGLHSGRADMIRRSMNNPSVGPTPNMRNNGL